MSGTYKRYVDEWEWGLALVDYEGTCQQANDELMYENLRSGPG